MSKRVRRAVPAALVVAACGAPGGNDAGPIDAGPRVVDAGQLDAGSDGGRLMDGGLSDGGRFDAGVADAGVCLFSSPGMLGRNDAGMKCVCEPTFGPGDPGFYEFCDPDLNNPCAPGCFNPKLPDGGITYADDAGTPVCYC